MKGGRFISWVIETQLLMLMKFIDWWYVPPLEPMHEFLS